MFTQHVWHTTNENQSSTRRRIYINTWPRCTIHQIHWDNGSSTEIMYDYCYSKLPETMRKMLKQPEGHLTSFAGQSVWPLGILSVPLTFWDHHTQPRNTQMIDFTIILSELPYNIIFGRSTMKKFEATISTIHGLIRFKTPNDYGTTQNKALAAPTSTFIAGKKKQQGEGQNHYKLN